MVNGWPHDVDVSDFLENANATPDLLLQTEAAPHGKTIALNAALSELSGEVIAVRDDDDEQGPEDLSEALAAYQDTGADIVAKIPHQVRIGNERWLFAETLANQWALFSDGSGDWRVSGSNILFHASLGPFPSIRLGETKEWARGLTEQGARIWRTSTQNYVWNRGRADHIWKAHKPELRHTFGMSSEPLNPACLAHRARRYRTDGTFEWVPAPSLEERLSPAAFAHSC